MCKTHFYRLFGAVPSAVAATEGIAYNLRQSTVLGERMQDWVAIVKGRQCVGLFDVTLSCNAPPNAPEGSVYLIRMATEPVLLAQAKSARQRVYCQLADMGLNPCHPAAALAESQQHIEQPGLHEASLRDLTVLGFVTIDNKGSRDLDQALYIDASPTGFCVYYALADAAWYVRPDSALFAEALARGASYYAPGLAVPMLPRGLSEGLISLNPQVLRRALVFEIHLNPQGEVQKTSVYQAKIKSRAQLTYTGVQHFLDARQRGAKHPYEDREYAQSLCALASVGQLRLQLAEARDVVRYERLESQIKLAGEASAIFKMAQRERNDVERYNEQISLLCNMEGAKLLAQHQRLTPELQAVFRVHLPPIKQRLQQLRGTIDALCKVHGLSNRWRWLPTKSLADYLQQLPREPKRLRQAIERQLLLVNHASQFTEQAGPHHALGVAGYARFSSPMREVVGIFTHKELLEAIGLLPAMPRSEDEALRVRVIAVANEAKKTQKALDKAFQLKVIDQLLHDDLSQELSQRPERLATVMGIRGHKIYLLLDDLGMDLKAYKTDLDAVWSTDYRFDRIAVQSSDDAPDFRLGDGVRVKTLAWDKERARFALAISPLDDCRRNADQ